MKILINFIILLLITTSCTLNKVVKKHGVRNLEKKQSELTINQSNSNDIRSILGPPSTKSTFDNDLWIFIEREIEKEKILKLSKEKLVKNNILILEINNQGLLVKKTFLNIDDMNEIKLSALKTEQKYSKNTFIYDFLSSMRQKINDPLGKRKKPKIK
jgi:outer membrane protein assembly factor BamE (lipoprotein component of BamABCDE complex)|tara:strand:+ start:241 stop:714 length:474 start_codon:yes stop_codon:yes gene_type:complete